MGILIGAEALGHEWPGKRVLQGQTFGVYEGDRIGIVGQNGGGKSTLLSLLSQRLEPDEGTITYRGGITVGVLGQDDALCNDHTVGHAIVGDRPAYEWASNPRIRDVLDELVGDLGWDGLVGNLSGGQRRRVDLARLLVGDWDVLMLDEPTNHLDLHAIRWLAAHLRGRWPSGMGALLVVTHDRWFLDEVCLRMWEVHDGRVEPFEGGYSAYVQQRVERERVAAVMEERRQNMLRKELNWLAHGAKARTSKPRFRVEAAMALVENDPPLRNPLELQRMAMSRLGKQVVELHDVSVRYPQPDGGAGRPVLERVSWILGPGDRVGILGENGAGKSTLLRVLSGRLKPSQGWIKIGKTVRFGWLDQRLELLGQYEDWRMEDLLGRFKRSYVVEGKSFSPQQLSERLGFERKELRSYIRGLSGGQRRRLALLCVLMEEPNVLILDEPGNDMDTDMLAVTEDLLDSWPGTLVMVSHDRSLLERVTDDQYSLIAGELLHCPGGVDEYLDRLDRHRLSAGEQTGTRDAEKQETRQKGMSNSRRRELKKRLDSVARRLERQEAVPNRLQDELRSIDPTDYAALVAKQAEIDQAQALLEDLESEWLELSEELGV